MYINTDNEKKKKKLCLSRKCIGRLTVILVVVVLVAGGLLGGKHVHRYMHRDAQPSQTYVDAIIAEENANMAGPHEDVDLGLSVHWASCNLGASQPYETGNFYAWGETKTKIDYNYGSSATYGKEMADISGNATYDAATANWGDEWRTPTYDEMNELIDKCQWTWTTGTEGIKGYEVTGPNGNSIFLPASGYYMCLSRNSVGEAGYYWTSTPDTSAASHDEAHYLGFKHNTYDVSKFCRYEGRTIRAVKD